MDDIPAAYISHHLDCIKLVWLNINIRGVENDKSHISVQIWVGCHQDEFCHL